MSSIKIYYLALENDCPSWGVALLHHHVRLLRQMGHAAFVLQKKRGFRLSWLTSTSDAPVRAFDSSFRPNPSDVLVVPEVHAHREDVQAVQCRRVVFVQGSFLIQTNFEEAVDYGRLGYVAAIAVLPHVCEIVNRFCGLTATLVPPFIASYFYASPREMRAERLRRILLVGKPEYRQAGYLDYDIAVKILSRHLRCKPEWSLMELAGENHRKVAKLMKESALLLNVNTLESFNATAPEAMAAGCLVTCYEAYGGRDFLRNGENAYVWPNNYIYPLLERLCEVIDRYDERKEELATMRAAARDTAERFRENETGAALRGVFDSLLRT